jgi:phage/plasmid-associated DNA primase
MAKLFPEQELREYMWEHLSSTLVGTALNQTFNNYLGGGRNGKSVLVTLMTKTLGE